MGWIIIHKQVRQQSAFGKSEAVYYFKTGEEARFKSFRGQWCQSCAAALEKFHEVLCRIQELWECKISPPPVTLWRAGVWQTAGFGLPSLMGSSPHGCEVKQSTKRSACRVERLSGHLQRVQLVVAQVGSLGGLPQLDHAGLPELCRWRKDIKRRQAWKLTCGCERKRRARRRNWGSRLDEDTLFRQEKAANQLLHHFSEQAKFPAFPGNDNSAPSTSSASSTF